MAKETATRMLPLLAVLIAGGCFNPEAMSGPVDPAEQGKGDDPEGDDEGDDEADECLPTDDPCEAADECCGFEGNGEIGDAMCAGFEEDYRCTNVCTSDDHCVEGCCIALGGVADYGACGSCAGLPFGGDAMTCLAGVEMLCSCVEGTDVACTAEERSAFEAACADPTSADGQLFVCMGNASSCSEAAEACVPE